MTGIIHTTAIIEEGAEIGKNVSIGAYSVIGPQVKLGDDCIIKSHVVMDGNLTVGKGNTFFQFTSIGAPPQDMTYKGEDTKVEIGDGNIFREYVSVHRGTLKENGLTKIGSNCLFMAYVHMGHDVVVGDNCIIANSVNLAGHVTVGEKVIIGGGCNISQFVSLGRGAYIGGASAIDKDVPLFCAAYGNRVRLKGINIVGLKRNGYSKPVISEVVDFFRTMEESALSPRAFIEHDELMKEFQSNKVIEEMAATIRDSEVGLAPFFKS